MQKWTRVMYQPNLPLGENGEKVTACKRHIALSKEAAKEGIVLLKNDGDLLPLAKGSKVALFGKASFDYVRGGGGSGEVTVSYARNLYEGLQCLKDQVSVYEELAAYYRDNVKAQYQQGRVPGMTIEPEVPSDLLKRQALTRTLRLSRSAVFRRGLGQKECCGDGEQNLCISEEAMAKQSAEIFEDGDFCLTHAERAMVDAVTANFSKVIVVMNVGGMVDSCWFHDDAKSSRC